MANDINFFRCENSLFFKKIKSKSDLLKEDNCDGYLIENEEKEVRRIIHSLKGSRKKIAVVGLNNLFNRRAIDTLKIDYLVSPEIGTLPDTLKQRDSGLNHVLAKEATKRNICIVIDFCEISKLSGKEKSLRIAKIIQNIKICKKAGCKIKIANFCKDKKNIVDEKGRISFGVSIGMSSLQSSDSVRF